MIKVVAIDDHQIMLDGLEALFNQHENIRLIKGLRTASEVMEVLDDEADIVLLDIDLGASNGMELPSFILEQFPKIRIIGFSMIDNRHIISSLMQMGCHGYVNKLTGESVLINAICTVHQGNLFLSSRGICSMADLLPQHSAMANTSVLTTREKEVLKYLTQDYSLSQISEKLFISRSTTESHKRNMMLKLKVKTLSGLTRYAIKQGWVEL